MSEVWDVRMPSWKLAACYGRSKRLIWQRRDGRDDEPRNDVPLQMALGNALIRYHLRQHLESGRRTTHPGSSPRVFKRG